MDGRMGEGMERRGMKGSDVVSRFVVMAKSNFTRICMHTCTQYHTHQTGMTHTKTCLHRESYMKSHKAHKSTNIPRNPHAQIHTKAQDAESAASLYFTQTGTRGCHHYDSVAMATGCVLDVGTESV